MNDRKSTIHPVTINNLTKRTKLHQVCFVVDKVIAHFTRPPGYDPVRDIRTLETPKGILNYEHESLREVGKLKNLDVKASKSKLTLTGSPVTYALGTNQYHLNCLEALSVWAQLGDQIRLNIWEGIVLQLEVGVTLETSWDVEFFLDELCTQSKGLVHQIRKDGRLEYHLIKNGSYELYLYDKGTEQGLGSRRLLRVEMRILRHLARDLKRPRVFVADLVDPNFLEQAFKLFQKRVAQIPVGGPLKTPPEVFESLSQADLRLYRQIMGEGGLDGYLRALRRETEWGKRSKSGFNKAQIRARELWEDLKRLDRGESPLLALKKEIAELSIYSRLRRKPNGGDDDQGDTGTAA